MNDIIGDTLTRINNSMKLNKKKVVVINTNLVREILKVLKAENMIHDYKVGEGKEGLSEREIEVQIKYLDDDFTVPSIINLEKVSKPGQRIYVKANEIVPVLNGRGVGIISTSKGVMSHAQAKSMNLGGEYLCKVW